MQPQQNQIYQRGLGRTQPSAQQPPAPPPSSTLCNPRPHRSNPWAYPKPGETMALRQRFYTSAALLRGTLPLYGRDTHDPAEYQQRFAARQRLVMIARQWRTGGILPPGPYPSLSNNNNSSRHQPTSWTWA
ncbi:hypothetical protein PG994_012340 [Apiospora phragmitis]|uniref:Uncharacterized protein n=1 Tax=Apiospora phragmitis TaxID=2905665 RepID=A0ABR1TVH3_9PEZI